MVFGNLTSEIYPLDIIEINLFDNVYMLYMYVMITSSFRLLLRGLTIVSNGDLPFYVP